MINNYEDFKKQVFSITSIDLNAYKEKQMKRRIDTLIARNKYDGYESYIKAIKSDSKLLATDTLHLQYGDRVTVVGTPEDIDHAEAFLEIGRAHV